MRCRTAALVAGAAIPVVMLVLLGAAAAPPVGLRLVPGVVAIEPGGTADVGVVLTVPAGWHTYWDGLNDSGYPPRITWELPAGFTAGDPAWPAPQRHVAAGEILDHVLDGEVVAVVPITAPTTVAPGGGATLRCRVEWLVCRDICVPGHGDVMGELAVAGIGERREDPAASSFLAAARARQPRPLPDASPVRWRRDANILTIEVPGARRLVLMPRSDSARPVDLVHQGAGDGPRLQLVLRPEDAGLPVRGVLSVDGAANWQLDIPPKEQQ